MLGAWCRRLGRTSPNAEMKAPQNLVVPQRTLFSAYQGGFRQFVSNVRFSGVVAPDYGTSQIAIKTVSIDDKFAPASAQIFFGNKHVSGTILRSRWNTDRAGWLAVESDRSEPLDS